MSMLLQQVMSFFNFIHQTEQHASAVIRHLRITSQSVKTHYPSVLAVLEPLGDIRVLLLLVLEKASNGSELGPVLPYLLELWNTDPMIYISNIEYLKTLEGPQLFQSTLLRRLQRTSVKLPRCPLRLIGLSKTPTEETCLLETLLSISLWKVWLRMTDKLLNESSMTSGATS
ncbi:MAG: hypothetical protein BYD32DRAFT_458038 [Podila humilis]|nr:MAG: hypothetical protein BYD32DRAFT_458038 [Podila humilis]